MYAADGFTDCLCQKSVQATQQGGELDSALQGVDLESGELALAEPPAGPGLEIDAWAAILQIAKNQVRREAAWFIAILLTTYFSTATIYHSYRVPSQPKEVINDPVAPTVTQSCKAGAPTGANAVRH